MEPVVAVGEGVGEGLGVAAEVLPPDPVPGFSRQLVSAILPCMRRSWLWNIRPGLTVKAGRLAMKPSLSRNINMSDVPIGDGRKLLQRFLIQS